MVVCDGSKKDGLFVYFAGRVRSAWDELPNTMTWGDGCLCKWCGRRHRLVLTIWW